jgi:zinc protease
MTWPLFVFTPEREREGRVLELLAQIMETKAFDDLRERLGKTYSPSVSTTLPDTGDQGAMNLTILTTPADVEVMEQASEAIAKRLADGQITAEDLERARKPILDGASQRRTSNTWWLTVLQGSVDHPNQLTAARSWDYDMATISLDEIKAAARKWLAQEPTTSIATPKPAATADASKPKT